MDVLETLSVALGLATLAGINLYLTVFVTGMAVHFGWVVLPSNLQDLLVLGDPWVIAISGGLYFMEFFADKVPWVDSANDALHTFVRPLGGALLAVLALGQADPSIKVIAALLAGGAALTAHAAKAGTRLVANFSPEPISNIGLSLGEDALVLGGLGLLLWHPIAALVAAILALGVIWTFLPRLLRAVRSTLWLAWRKVMATVGSAGTRNDLPVAIRALLHREGTSVAVAAPCIIAAGPVGPKGVLGWLARLTDGRLLFVSFQRGNPRALEIPLAGSLTDRESRFLCETLLVSPPQGKSYEFIFEAGSGAFVDDITAPAREAFGKKKRTAVAV
jgi:Domain of unknown function (DUF4126)